MNLSRLSALLALALFHAPLHAQEKPRKTMTFPAGTPAPNVAPAGAVTAAGDLASPEAPAQIAGAFFAMLQRGEIDKAYEELTRGSKIAERPDDLKTLKAKTREAVEVFGKIHGYELVDSKNVGVRLLRRTYLSLGKEFPLRWRFYFYKSESAWRLIDLRVDDRLSGMFDEPDEPRTSGIETK